MAELDDLPDPPPGPSDPFQDPSMAGGGYLGGNDDDEIRKIRRRVSPVGKVLVLLVLGAVAGTGYYIWNTAQEDARADRDKIEGRTELERILGQTLPREQLATQIRDVYARHNHSPELRMSARRVLAHIHDAQAVPLMIEGLRGSTRERQQAALALAEIGLPGAAGARDALFEVLPRTDPQIDRADVAWAMVVLNDPRVWDSVVELLGTNKLQQVTNLDDPPRRVFDTALVARMAGRERLIRLATDTHVGIRRIAAVSLAELATPDTYDTLVSLSRDPDADVAREAAIGLGRTGDARAGEPIVAFLNAHPDSRDGVLNALRVNSGAPGLSVVMRASSNPETKSQAIRLLRELHDPDAAPAFQQILASVPATATEDIQRNMRKNAIFGIAEIGDPAAADGLMELAQRPMQPGARIDPNADSDARLALDALRKIPGAPARAKAGLLAILPTAEFMRTQVLLALGATGDPSLGAQIMTHMANADAQEGAAVAVCHLGYAPGIARVRADMRRPPALHMNVETVQDEPIFIKRRNAIRAIAWTRDAVHAPELLRIVDDPLDRRLLREEAGHTLAAIADDRTLEDIAVRAMDTARPEDARMFYLFALRARSTPAISNRLIEAYVRPGTNVGLMRAAAIAAGFGGDDTTAAALRPLIASTDANVKLNAGIASILCGDDATATAMLDSLGSNREFAELLANVFVTRQASGNNSGVQQEPFELLPVTESMFTDGRSYRRINMATSLERGRGASHFDFAILWLRLRMRNGWEHPLGIGQFGIRGKLRDAATGTDAFRREMAFRMIRSVDDRGALLWLRRQPGDAGERARRELLEMSPVGS